MNILLSYGYEPHTTAVYIERALRKHHSVYAVTSPGADRAGYARNEDVYALVERGAIPQPDLVLHVDAGPSFFPRGLERFECPVAGYVIDTHLKLEFLMEQAVFFDHIFVCHRDYISDLQAAGFENLSWMPVGADPEIHGEVKSERTYDVGFVGSLGVSAERRALLESIERRFSTNDFRKHYPKEELASIYSRSKIIFNYSVNRDITMRVFEALAAGGLLVSNPMANGIDDVLTRGEHYVEYADEASLLEQIEYYLSHPEERERIAAAGQRAVLERHTYAVRVAGMLDRVAANASARTAKARRMSLSQLRAAYGRIYSQMRLVDASLDEFDIAWRTREGRLEATKAATLTLLRRLNATMLLTRILRRK